MSRSQKSLPNSSRFMGFIRGVFDGTALFAPVVICASRQALAYGWTTYLHLQQRLGVAETENVAFVQKSADAFAYRDGLRFANGKEILLQQLRYRQRVDVLSLAEAIGAEMKTEEHEMLEEEFRQLLVR